jgi:hypothetical protein
MPVPLDQNNPHLPAPPHRDAIAAALVAVIGGAPFVADLPVDECQGRRQILELASGWRLEVRWWEGAMGPLEGAHAPGGGRWERGCDRWPDWLAGPDAELLDPIEHLLSAEQRDDLRQLLTTCVCWPLPELPPAPDPPSAKELFEGLQIGLD